MMHETMRGGEDLRRPHTPWFETPARESKGGLLDDSGPSLRPLLQPPGKEANDSKQTMSFPRWCSMVPVWCLRSRTPFAAFLSASTKLSGCSQPCSALFPIPAPYDGSLWARMTPGISAKKRRTLHFRRFFFCLIMALNFWHSGGDFACLKRIGREPQSVHRTIYARLKALIRADGQCPAFPCARAGRRFPELIARLAELSDVVTSSGVTGDGYSKTFPGVFDDGLEDEEELRPYRKADPDRIKLSGKGLWDCTAFLDDDLCMPYREPELLWRPYDPDEGEIPRMMETEEDTAALARLWDAHSLLYVHDYDIEGYRGDEVVRVFGALKDSTRDRQIGDRRGRNLHELRIQGPSSALPSATDLGDIFIDTSRQRVSIYITDRRDFYHQIWATPSRAVTNSIGPGLDPCMLEGTDALNIYLLEKAKKGRRREVVGDGLGPWTLRPPRGNKVYASFKSILQGDHLGVEIACSAHQQLLANYDLLASPTLISARAPPVSSSLYQGLCIDDYFAISLEDKGQDGPSRSSLCFAEAKRAYADHGLAGSDDKDVVGASQAKVIGGYINGGRDAAQHGLATLSSPIQKRLGLAAITFELIQLAATTDQLHLSLVGGWTSVILFRRPFMGLLDRAFNFVDMTRYSPSESRVVPLPRGVSNELCLLAVMAPIISTNLSADYFHEIFATDASNQRGAVVAAPLTRHIYQALWRCTKTKGSYTRLQNLDENTARRLDIEVRPPEDFQETVKKPLAYDFEFIEVYAGSAKITKYVSERGFRCGPPIELSASPELNMKFTRLIEWLTHLILHRGLSGFAVEPPCTTFSIMRRPALRDKLHPYGIDTTDPQTLDGNILGQRAFQLMHVGGEAGCAGLLETPNSSKLKNMPSWGHISRRRYAGVYRTDSCRFGSPHLKSFKFLTVNLKLKSSILRCNCQKPHLKVQGSLTKQSATYVDDLASAIAEDFAMAILARNARLREEDLEVWGLENQLVNEVMLTSRWSVKHDWKFQKEGHINLLEIRAVHRLIRDQVYQKSSYRVAAMVDSYVTRGAISKGRSSSRAITALLRQIDVELIVGGTYLVTPYVPTRLNCADDPTRLHSLRSPISGLSLEHFDEEEIYRLGLLKGSRKWASNWIRLTLLLTGPVALLLKDHSLFRRRYPMDFDATLGFPGEGPPSCFDFCSILLTLWICYLGIIPLPRLSFLSFLDFYPRDPVPGHWMFSPSRWLKCAFLFLMCFHAPGASAMDLGPRNAGDSHRLGNRRDFGDLPDGRVVLGVTASQRQRHLATLTRWAEAQDVDVVFMIQNYQSCLEELNIFLCSFGRVLYSAGRPYNHFVECLNAITSWQPNLRRQLQRCWDLAFNWVRQEPSVHHVAAPYQVLLAMLSICMLWGWMPLASSLALMWGGLLRPGELLSALRCHLLVPSDVGGSLRHCLLTLLEPKTRYTAARHQLAKVDIPDLVEVIEIGFSGLCDFQKLWPMSGQTLRTRFKLLLSTLQLPIKDGTSGKPLDLGSLRPGGATWYLQTLEDGELVRRRGRWITTKIMDVYIQEVAAIQYLRLIEPASLKRVMMFANLFSYDPGEGKMLL